MLAIFKKELWNFFGNWSAWIIIAAFSIISALFLFFFENNFNIFEIGSATLQSFFVLSPWLFMFIIPAISMRTLAEEEQSGTLFWLFSQPVKITEIVGGKFLSVWLVGILCLLPSLVYYYTIYVLGVPEGNIDGSMNEEGNAKLQEEIRSEAYDAAITGISKSMTALAVFMQFTLNDTFPASSFMILPANVSLLPSDLYT